MTNDKVVFQVRTGNDFVQNTMTVSAAKEFIKNGTVTESDREGFPICVNDVFYFPDLLIEPESTPKSGKRKGKI